MKRFEHYRLVSGGNGAGLSQDELDAMSLRGWELVTVCAVGRYYHSYWKRPVRLGRDKRPA